MLLWVARAAAASTFVSASASAYGMGSSYGGPGYYGNPPPTLLPPPAMASPPPPAAQPPHPPPPAAQPPPAVPFQPSKASIWVNATFTGADAASLDDEDFVAKLRAEYRAAVADVAGVELAAVRVRAVLPGSIVACAEVGYASNYDAINAASSLPVDHPGGDVFAGSEFLGQLGDAELATDVLQTEGGGGTTASPPPQGGAEPPKSRTPPSAGDDDGGSDDGGDDDGVLSPPPGEESSGGLLDDLPLELIAGAAGGVVVVGLGAIVLLRRRRRGGKKRGAARRSDRDGRNDFTSYFPEENAFSSLEVDEDAMGSGVELGGIGRGGRVGQRSFY